MTDHLMEAIKINFQRRKLYARLTKGRSKKISNLMIGFEILSLPTALWLDQEGKKWQKKGIPLMVHEFISMEETPPFREDIPFAFEKLLHLPQFDTDILIQDLKTLFQQNDYPQLIQRCQKALLEISSWPHLHCMLRHILESLIRTTNLSLKHQERAKELNLNFNTKACTHLINGHIQAIPGSHLLDRMAFPLQNDGVPIIFQDVPIVPPTPEQYP
jgi:hypothetical protein